MRACVCLFAFPAHRVELGLLKGVRGEAWGVGPDAAGKTENSAKPEKCVFGEPMRLRFGVVSTAKRRTLGVPSTSCPPLTPPCSAAQHSIFRWNQDQDLEQMTLKGHSPCVPTLERHLVVPGVPLSANSRENDKYISPCRCT